MIAFHEKACLLRSTRLALVVALLFAASGTLDLLKIFNLVPNARRNPLLPFLLVGAIALGAYLLKVFTCAIERVILVLMLAAAIFKLVSVLEPRLFAEIDKYELVAATVLSFSCAAISALVALRGFSRASS